MGFVVGIDEVGRGPLAGPVSVGVVLIDRKELGKWGRVSDSKKQTSAKREEIFKKIKEMEVSGKIFYKVCSVCAGDIDKFGIARAIALAMARAMRLLNVNPKTEILLDGSLRAPKDFLHQKTIIKGDEKETVIALASICAKVVRDRKMVSLAKKFPGYFFEENKGYGTYAHRVAIRKLGLSKEHRKTFCKNASSGSWFAKN